MKLATRKDRGPDGRSLFGTTERRMVRPGEGT